MYNGILSVYKEKGMTSFDVVSVIRKLTDTKKVGHTGTLDPDAEGVLVVCVGEALKCVEYMTDKNKEYEAEITFGTSTDTQDASGKIISESGKRIAHEELERIVRGFNGDQTQISPLYSAVKINGTKYCDIVRKGLDIEFEPKERNIKIHSIYIKNVFLNDDNKVERASLYIQCSKGTYIRTVCNDIGELCGVPAHMSYLLRTRSGNYKIEDSYKIEDLKTMKEEGNLKNAFFNNDTAFHDCKEYIFDSENIKRIINGIPIRIYLLKNREKHLFSEGDYIRIYDEENKFRTVGKVFKDTQGLIIKSYRIFND